MDTATASQELPRSTAVVAAVALGAAALQVREEVVVVAQVQVPLQAPQAPPIQVAVAVAVQPVVQLVALVALVLSLFVTQMFQQFQPNLLQS